jgi:hypothetical protein
MRGTRAALLSIALVTTGSVDPHNSNRAHTAFDGSPEIFHVGMLRVERTGRHAATPIILIPALVCGPWQWRREVPRQERHETLASMTAGGTVGAARESPPPVLHYRPPYFAKSGTPPVRFTRPLSSCCCLTTARSSQGAAVDFLKVGTTARRRVWAFRPGRARQLMRGR